MELPMKTITLTLNWREYDELAEHVGELVVPWDDAGPHDRAARPSAVQDRVRPLRVRQDMSQPCQRWEER
jgi:hypothetical protein